MDSIQLPNQEQLAVSAGREVNSHGRFYQNGAAYSVEAKLAIANTYQQLARTSKYGRPNLSQIAREHCVDVKTVKKVEDELLVYGRVRCPNEIRANADRPVGPGSICLNPIELYIILRLRDEDPRRHLHNYRDWIMLLTGKTVSIQTISQVLLHGFPFKGSLLKPNLIPFDKFKPENEVRAYRFLETLFAVNPGKVVFADEKHLKGQELFSQKVRRCPETGQVPSILVDSDFRNTHSITGFCTINRRKVAPIWYLIHNKTNNKDLFYETAYQAGMDGFFEPHDVLVLDNSGVHNDVEDMMWRCFRVLVIFLPTRTPEWNPKELIWSSLVQKLGAMPITALEAIRRQRGEAGWNVGTNSIVALAAAKILDEMSFDEVCKHYSKCFNFFPQWRNLKEKASQL